MPGSARMDVDAVLQSVQERDKWRRRLALLTASLTEVRERRRRSVARLRKIQGELRKLAAYSDALLDHSGAPGANARINAARNPGFPGR